MSITRESWQEKAKEKLQIVGGWLQRRSRGDLRYVVYSTVTGMALWPVIQTAITTGQVEPALTALSTVTAGVGANLLANQIEAWKQQSTPPTEEDVMQWIAGNAPANDELRQALDEILEKLDAVPMAQNALPPAEREQFADALREELKQLGNLSRFEAELGGSGAIAQGDSATAISHGGVQARDVSGPIITGGHINIYNTPPPKTDDSGRAAGSPPNAGGIPPRLLHRLRAVLEQCGPFDDEQELRALFSDQRIDLWRSQRPQTSSSATRLDSTIAFLSNRANASKENGLVLFLRVLRDRLHPDDACHGQIGTLADELEQALRTS